MRYRKFVAVALALGLGMAVALLWLLTGPPTVRADPDILYVATDGDDANDCSTIPNRCRTVQRAVEMALTGDEIWVAGGVYTDTDTATEGCVVLLNKSVTLRGGYDGSFTDPPDPAANPTTLDALRQGRVISITANITPTIAGFIITGGDATGLGAVVLAITDAGGGIYCYQAHPTIADNVITDNIANRDGDGAGGGLYMMYCDRATISGNTIVSNTASAGGSGRGGGLNLDHSDATLSGNVIMSNTAGTVGSGGGLSLNHSDVTVSGNTVAGNVGGPGNCSQGGGFHVSHGAVTVTGCTVRGNVAQTPGLGPGGGFSVGYADALTLDGNSIINNSAELGSGVFVSLGSTVTLTNNIIAGNQAMAAGEGMRVYGSAGAPSTVTLLHNTIADNPGPGGAGLSLWGENVALTLTNNIIAGHAVGITNSNPVSSTVTADHTLFYNNTTDYGPGVSSANEVTGDPRFVNPASLDYHIGLHSAATDQAVDIGVTTDIDGDARPAPAGTHPDLGADEIAQQWVYLPLILRQE